MPNRPPAEKKPLYWVDPMHPWYKSDKPGIAPDCNMKLVPVFPGEEARYERRANRMPEGSVQITPEKQQLIGVEYGTAEYENVSGAVRAVARVTLDETKVAKVNSKLEGWLDQVFVDSVGRQVTKGEPAAHHLQPGGAGHAAGISAGDQRARHDARQPGPRDAGQHGEPGGLRQEAPGTLGHQRPRRSPRSPRPASRSRT